MHGWSHVCWWMMWCINLQIISCCSCIVHSYFLFIVWVLINDIIIIKFGWFIMAIVNDHFTDMSFNLFSPFIWCTISHFVCIGDQFWATFSPSWACLSGVTVDDLVYMWPKINSWIQFWFIILPPRFWFLLGCLVWLSYVSCPMLKQDFNCGCKGFFGLY